MSKSLGIDQYRLPASLGVWTFQKNEEIFSLMTDGQFLIQEAFQTFSTQNATYTMIGLRNGKKLEIIGGDINRSGCVPNGTVLLNRQPIPSKPHIGVDLRTIGLPFQSLFCISQAQFSLFNQPKPFEI